MERINTPPPGHLLQRVKIFATCMKAAHDQGNRAAADVIPAAAVIIGYATLTHIYDSKDCSTVLHKCMLSRKFFLLRENYTTMCFKPIIRIRTPVKQYAHTGSSEIRTPMKRNLHFIQNKCIEIYYYIQILLGIFYDLGSRGNFSRLIF